MKKKRLRRILGTICAFVSILAILAGIGVTALAAWSGTSSTTNYISTPDFNVKTEEVYDPPEEGLSPGVETEKRVTVRNLGNVPVFVRVQFEILIGTKDADGHLTPDLSLDPSNIILKINDQEWKFADDWYFYQKVLDPGVETEPVLYSFHLKEDAGPEYTGKDCQILVHTESLQATEGAMSAWGYTKETFPVPWEATERDVMTTQILFLDPLRKFDIETEKTDLFANFKDVLPGETYVQPIVIGNEYDEAMSMRFVYMGKGNESIDPESKLYAMLEQYMNVKVQNVDESVVSDGPVATDGTCDIDLGNFGAGETKQMLVTLTVSPEMTTEYASLLADVDWSIEAYQEDPPKEPEVPDGEGDLTGELPEVPKKEDPEPENPPQEEEQPKKPEKPAWKPKPVPVEPKKVYRVPVVDTADVNLMPVGIALLFVGLFGLLMGSLIQGGKKHA